MLVFVLSDIQYCEYVVLRFSPAVVYILDVNSFTCRLSQHYVLTVNMKTACDVMQPF
jgi:hypothetical protein